VLDYKVEKKADGWYVAGERFSNQTSATRYLIALFTGKATPKKAAASTPKKAAPKKAAASTPKKAAPKKEAAPERPVAGRVKLPELYPKGAGLVAGYVFTLTANGTQWSLAQGVRGRDIPAKADGRGNVVLASGAQISVTGLNIHRAGGDRTPAPAPAPVVLPALPPARQISPDKYARRVVPVQRERVRDAFPVLGGGLIETDEEGGAKHRPFVVVEVAPDKVRPFYMSTGTGGQTGSGEWNLFGGIAEQSGRVNLGWFIKPTEGKRVEKYAAVSAFLTEKFGEDSDTAWRRIQRAVPGAKVYSELVGGELPAEETPRRVERRKRRRIMGGLLNSYLGKLNAIAAFQPDFEPEVGHRRSAGEHKTVYGAGRVAFNPRNPLRMETDAFHPSNWLGNATKGATLRVYPKGAKERALSRGVVFIEPVASPKSGFPLVNLQIRYQTEASAHRDSDDDGFERVPGGTLFLEYTFDTPDGRRVWRVSYGARRPARANEGYPDAPSSLVEAARVAARDFERLFGQARRNPLDAREARAEDGTPFLRVNLGKGATLDVVFSSTGVFSRGPRKVFILASSRGDRGGLVRELRGSGLTEYDVLEAATKAESYASVSRGVGNESAYAYYTALTDALTQIAATLQKGMKRRNPLEAYRQTAPDGTTFQRVYVGRDATLDIEFSQTDWSRPGAPKTVRVLPSSRGHRGTLVRNLTNRWSTADEVLTAAVAAEASADDMLNAYPRYEYRDAAHYYEGLTEVLTDLASSLQRGWR
jgi:hypothetical protein